jgi:hypothetical protein
MYLNTKLQPTRVALKKEREVPSKTLTPAAATAPTMTRIKSHRASDSAPLHAESSSQARSSNNASFTQSLGNNEDTFELTGVTLVARFLNACSPPMAHFLQPLINFGCTSEEYLIAISTWPTSVETFTGKLEWECHRPTVTRTVYVQ